jgi:histone acetyltransferase (RNA polymerase elongator complex component)
MIIPFFIPHAGCPHQCVFCDQRKISGRKQGPDRASLAATITAHLETSAAATTAEVAFYGGSFTAIPAEDQRAYLQAVQPFIDAGSVQGIRVSTRPDCISSGGLALLRRHRVATVELGVQSLDDAVLRLAGRGHSAEDSVNAVALLRREGLRTGLQLMPGLPGDSAGRFRRTVRQAIALRPDFVRIYPTVVIAGTPLEELFRSGRYAPLSLADAVAWCRDAAAAFADAGIAVVRIGLQAAETLSATGTVAAGPWHPAFGQLVESSAFLDRMRRRLRDRPSEDGAAVFTVHPSDLSSAIGQKRANVRTLEREFSLSKLSVAPDQDAPKGSLLLRTSP